MRIFPFNRQCPVGAVLQDDDGEEILEDSGECEVSAHELSAFIQPQKTGTYRFKYIYEIAGETWVDNVKIKVG